MEKKNFINEVEKYRKLLNSEAFEDYLSSSALYNYLKGNCSIDSLTNYYKFLLMHSDITILSSDVLDNIIKEIIPVAQKYGAEGIPEEIDNNYDVSFATAVNIVVEFVKEFFPEYLDHFMDIMSNRFYLLEEHGSTYNAVHDNIRLYDTNSIATCYVLLHELMHSENGGDVKNHFWTVEVPSYASEYFLNDYIKGYYKTLEEDSNLWLRVRLSDDVESSCGYVFMRKLKEHIDSNIEFNKDVVNELLGSITKEFGIHEIYVLSSIEKFFFVAKKYDDMENNVKAEDIENVSVEEFNKSGIKKYDKHFNKMRECISEGYTIIFRCLQHAVGATLGFKLYQNMFDKDYDTEEFRNINANIHNYSVEDLVNILSLKDKNGYNKDELNNMKEAFQMRLKRLDNE